MVTTLRNIVGGLMVAGSLFFGSCGKGENFVEDFSQNITREPYVHMNDTDDWDIYIEINGEHKQLTSGPALDNYPILSPDRKRVAFTSWEPEKSETLRIININGTGLQEIASDAGIYDIRWSGDGKRVIYNTNYGKRETDIATGKITREKAVTEKDFTADDAKAMEDSPGVVEDYPTPDSVAKTGKNAEEIDLERKRLELEERRIALEEKKMRLEQERNSRGNLERRASRQDDRNKRDYGKNDNRENMDVSPSMGLESYFLQGKELRYVKLNTYPNFGGTKNPERIESRNVDYSILKEAWKGEYLFSEFNTPTLSVHVLEFRYAEDKKNSIKDYMKGNFFPLFIKGNMVTCMAINVGVTSPNRPGKSTAGLEADFNQLDEGEQKEYVSIMFDYAERTGMKMVLKADEQENRQLIEILRQHR